MMAKRRPRRTEVEARRQMRENAERTRLLAEKALAELPPSVQEQRERAGSNAAWLEELAELAFATLPPDQQQTRKQAGSNAEWLRRLAERAQREVDARELQGE
jgi:hypothetical protein